MTPDTTVPSLFGSAGPSAVLGRVRPVVVDSFEGKPWRAQPHIRQEGREVVYPTVAYSDTSAAVVVPSRVGRVSTASLHVHPAVEFARLGGSVREIHAAGVLGFGAPARDGLSGPEPHLAYGLDGAARATASPCSDRVRPWMRQGEYGQAAECLSGEVESHRHVATIAQMGAMA